MHIPPFLRILLHHLPDSGFMPVVSTFSCCFWFYLMMNLFLFGVLASIRTGGVNVTFDLYQNFSECCQLLFKHTSRCRSIFGFHILLSDTAVESCVTFKPRKAPIQLIQFSRSNNQKFCRYTFLYLFDLMPLYPPLLLMSIALHAL